MKAFLIVLGVLLIAAVGVGFIAIKNDEAKHPALNNPNLKIDDIRGDRLGMSLSEYTRKHAGECGGLGKERCVGYETYAGVTALKAADFTNDGKLWKLTYGVDPLFAEELLRSLKEKYGDPGCIAAKGHTCRWTNGRAAINFTHFGTGASADFVDQKLRDIWVAQSDSDRAQRRKKDQ